MKLIIFDMDGTLIDSGELIANTINHVRHFYDLPPMEKGELLRNVNNPHIDAARFFYGTDTFKKKQRDLFSEYYNIHCKSDLRVYDGIPELLQKLQPKYHLSVATNASSNHANTILKNAKLLEYFELVVGADMVANPKPKPDMLLHTLEKIGVDKSRAYMIGDSQKDRLAAQSAGVRDIMVNWGFSFHEDEVIDDVTQLHKIFEI